MLRQFLSDATRKRWQQKVYRWARKTHGRNNTKIVRTRMHKVRPPISATFDTVVAQLCKIERGAWYSTGKSKWGTELVDQGFYGPMESPFTDEQKTEIPYINTICELVRNGQMDLYQVPTIEDEKRKSPKRHSDHTGCVNVDHGIKYKDLGFECGRMKFTLSKVRGFPFPQENDDCSMNIGGRAAMLQHFSGKHQSRDAWHLMLCDSFGIEFFFTCDGKFLRRYNQIHDKLALWGIRTRVMRPSEFCNELGCRRIPVAPTDPYGLFRGTIR